MGTPIIMKLYHSLVAMQKYLTFKTVCDKYWHPQGIFRRWWMFHIGARAKNSNGGGLGCSMI
jgi:hypothetical protein